MLGLSAAVLLAMGQGAAHGRGAAYYEAYQRGVESWASALGTARGARVDEAGLAAAAGEALREFGRAAEADVSLRVVADHLRAVAFLHADGVIPANEGRGYVLRRLLRRAVRHGMRLGFDEPFLCRLLPVAGEAMGDAYPELGATRSASEATVRAEEEKFLATVAASALPRPSQ